MNWRFKKSQTDCKVLGMSIAKAILPAHSRVIKGFSDLMVPYLVRRENMRVRQWV